MDLTAIIILVLICGALLFGAAFGVWSWRQRMRVRKHWKVFARESEDARYIGGIFSHPRLEFAVDDLQFMLMLATYRKRPDRIVVHVTLQTLPPDFAVGKLGLSNGLGRMIAGQPKGHVLEADVIEPGWILRAGDREFAERCLSDSLLVSELRRMNDFDRHACVEWQRIKYSTEDYVSEDAALLGLVDIGLGVATPLRRLTRPTTSPR